MPNSIVEKKWTRWYPKKIFLKNKKDEKKILLHSDKFKIQDFFIELKNKKKSIIQKDELETNLTENKIYEIGFKKGFLKGETDSILLKNKLHSLFLDFEKSLSIFENKLCSQLLKIVLKISAYVIGKKIDIDESILKNYIKNIIDKDGVFLKKPQIIVHPNNKNLIENILSKFLKDYKWKIVYDTSIDLNSCKIHSETGDIDTTVDARWQEVCRLIYSEEH